jgi:hypothetical protein
VHDKSRMIRKQFLSCNSRDVPCTPFCEDCVPKNNVTSENNPNVDGRILKVDPETNEVAGMVSVGTASWESPLVVYGGGVWAMGQAGAPREPPKHGRSKWIAAIRLVRVDPSTMHIVAAEYLTPFYSIAAGALAAGGGYVWFSSGEGLARVSP